MEDFKPEDDTLFLIAAEMGLIVLGEKRDEVPAAQKDLKPSLTPTRPFPEKPYSQLT